MRVVNWWSVWSVVLPWSAASFIQPHPAPWNGRLALPIPNARTKVLLVSAPLPDDVPCIGQEPFVAFDIMWLPPCSRKDQFVGSHAVNVEMLLRTINRVCGERLWPGVRNICEGNLLTVSGN